MWNQNTVHEAVEKQRFPKQDEKNFEKSLKKVLTKRNQSDIINKLLHESKRVQKNLKKVLKKLLTTEKHYDIMIKLLQKKRMSQAKRFRKKL